ncbi:VOC family protein [Pseudoroseomonas cervicalis]|uniref:VOC family protein n=1 Tax=Teichococcus cervicalis TaxID=204525 RepID=UPI00277D8694|nr:VOC family protein [Pseudoroseomonas cervicalis]MDQ1081685.1 catechol 2,3-dioxygenase-like lactoylglutathione lyase family enzyme [Pseudoroseomonas cervicalis]
MGQIPPRIDHVVITVRDRLDEAAAQYRRLGFALTERGHHSLGSSNHLAIFGQDYLELLGFEPGRAQQRADLWHYPDGLSGLVFKPLPEPGFFEALRGRGVPVGPDNVFHRPVRTAEGEADARFRTATLQDPAIRNGRIFFCHHETPELVWRDEWRGHANGARGIAEFVIASRDPDATAAPYRALFGAAALQPVPGGLALATDTARILLLSPEAVAERFGDAAPVQPDGSDRMVALGLVSGRLDGLAERLRGAGIAGLAERGGRLVVPAAEAAGLALAFQPAEG